MQTGGDLAAGGGLAATDLAGEQADAAQFEQVEQARLGFAASLGLEQLVGVVHGLEGVAGEGEVLEIHQLSCSGFALSPVWSCLAGAGRFCCLRLLSAMGEAGWFGGGVAGPRSGGTGPARLTRVLA